MSETNSDERAQDKGSNVSKESSRSSFASNTFGVKVMSLEGRLYRERERLHSMTEEERCWRARWVKDQNLAPKEPILNVYYEHEKQLFHPLRRLYRIPANFLAEKLIPMMGITNSYTYRYVLTNCLLGVTYIYLAAYYLKYNTNDWTRKGGWHLVFSRSPSYNGEDPSANEIRSPSDYADRGFKNSPI